MIGESRIGLSGMLASNSGAEKEQCDSNKNSNDCVFNECHTSMNAFFYSSAPMISFVLTRSYQLQ